MKLFVFEPKQYGPNSYYVMSETLEDAIKSIKSIWRESKSYEEMRREYREVKEYNKDEPCWSENA